METPKGEYWVSLVTPALKWFGSNQRAFPWRETVDPYAIFIAEVLLRRTQANRVVGTYQKLIRRYPTPRKLSNASTSELRKLFRPIGLFRRAEQLVSAAKQIVTQHGGLIPKELDVLSKLPGMGDYSSRAVLCLAFGNPVPMIDESSGRLLRRFLNLRTGRPAYSDYELLKVAETIIPRKHARMFNLALLDIAAAYCRPKNPCCTNCPLASPCSYAWKHKNILVNQFEH